MVPEETINVAVEGSNPVNGGYKWTKELNLTVNNYSYNSYELEDALISNMEVGDTFGVVVALTDSQSGHHNIKIQKRNPWGSGDDLPSIKNSYDDGNGFKITDETTIEFVLTQDDIKMIKDGNGIAFWGVGVIVESVYVK